MAEKITHQSTERSAEEQGRRLPFAPIFDTISPEPALKPELESAPKSPSSTEDYADSARRSSADVNNFSFSTARERPEPGHPAGHYTGISNWIVAVGLVLVALTLSYMSLQLREQRQVLSEQLQQLLRATQESRQLEQRPWVGIADAVPQPLTATGGTFNITLQNFGKTPAIDVHASGYVVLQDSPEISLSNEETAHPVQLSAGSLSPGAVQKSAVEFRIPLASVAALYRNQVYAVLHVSVTYKDVFQAAHTTQSCFYWQPNLRGAQACEGHNTVN